MICFLCQQMAEKCLKALLHERRQIVPRTHDRESLIRRLAPTGPKLGSLAAGAAELSRFAVESRYPTFWPNATHSRGTWAAAERIRAEVRRRLGTPVAAMTRSAEVPAALAFDVAVIDDGQNHKRPRPAYNQ